MLPAQAGRFASPPTFPNRFRIETRKKEEIRTMGKKRSPKIRRNAKKIVPPAAAAVPAAAPAHGSRFSKTRRAANNPVALPSNHPPRFIPVPFDPPQNLTLSLDTILPEKREELASADALVFHCVGDTGGIHGSEAQAPVAFAMEHQVSNPDGVRPSFFYHLGDVVYFNGQENLYDSQFYEPYQYYPGPIVAIPGNHDGDTKTQKNDPPDKEKSLTGFRDNFCAPQATPVTKYRELMTQPYVYWTLEAPFVTIVGLYSNVDGSLDGRGRSEQQDWFVEQLQAAPKDKWLLLAVHHCPYSLDSMHGGYPVILSALEQAAAKANRWPDVVLSGHVHNYQRFERKVKGRKIPFIVAGAGGYADTSKSLHKLHLGIPTDKTYPTSLPDVSLMHCEEALPGFLRITVNSNSFLAEYFTVPFGDAQHGIPTLADQVKL
jgi:predicted phosphodiesterase